MRKALLTLGVFLVGCAAAQPQPSVVYVDRTEPAPVRASALVFDPPVTAVGPQLDLSREGRGESAYVGYEESNATFYYIRQDDRQAGWGYLGGGWGGRGSVLGNGNYFERRAITETVGVRYR